jgi:hypothetical protein
MQIEQYSEGSIKEEIIVPTCLCQLQVGVMILLPSFVTRWRMKQLCNLVERQ